MKKIILILLACLWLPRLQASTFFEQLCQYNFNWAKYAHRAPAGEARLFSGDREYIQAHLGEVLLILNQNPVDHLSSAQKQMRMHLVQVLSEYRTAGRFPRNYYRLGRVPVFIDEHDTHCAVGHMMLHSDHDALARRIAAADNYAWVKDIHEPGLAAWQQMSGFTVDELKLIQGAYDWYQPDAMIAVNRHDIPQKPGVMNEYFESPKNNLAAGALPLMQWCKGEGVNGVLNGRWVQNYRIGMPWIEGFFENGKRTGQWKEYYQGTRKLCRTEVWVNDKLNGKRIRFNREGNVIEEIMFKDGKAVTKTNFDAETSLKWVRKPIDSTLVWTEVYNAAGEHIASGHERVYNPGNLQWFQNIELTALNSIGIQSRSIDQGSVFPSGINIHGGVQYPNLYLSPQLVEYKKVGDWRYYKEKPEVPQVAGLSRNGVLWQDYPHFAGEFTQALDGFEDVICTRFFDSLQVTYGEYNQILNQEYYSNYLRWSVSTPMEKFVAYGVLDYLNYAVEYRKHDSQLMIGNDGMPLVRLRGHYTRAGQKSGIWNYYDKNGLLYKREEFIRPGQEAE